MLGSKSWLFLVVAVFCLSASTVSAIQVAGDEVKPDTVEADIGAATSEGSRTDDNVVGREEEAIKLDGFLEQKKRKVFILGNSGNIFAHINSSLLGNFFRNY